MSQKDFLHWNSQKSQTWVFAGKTGEISWEKSLTFFQNPLFWQVCYRSRLKWCFYCKFLQKFRVWFFAKIDGFFPKRRMEFFKNEKYQIFFFKLRLNLYNGIRLLKTFKIWGFFGKIDGLLGKNCCFLQNHLTWPIFFRMHFR